MKVSTFLSLFLIQILGNQTETCNREREREYPAAFLSEGSASIEGAKEEESGSDAMDRHLELNLGFPALNLDLGQWKLQRCIRFIGPESDKDRPRQIIPLPKAELSLWFRTRRNRESSCSSADLCVSSVRERKGQRRGFLSSVRVAPCQISYNMVGNGRKPRGVTTVIGILFFFYFFIGNWKRI